MSDARGKKYQEAREPWASERGWKTWFAALGKKDTGGGQPDETPVA